MKVNDKINNIPLVFATNMFGNLKPAVIKRIERYLKKPSIARWEDIHCIIINNSGKMCTIWQALIKVDPFFPNRGRSTDMEGNVIREWERIPTADEVRKAINHVVYKSINNVN